MTRVALTMVALCFVLSGCVATSVPAGLSAQEQESYVALERQKLWMQTGLDGSLRPEEGAAEFVSWGHYQQRYVECMNATDTRGLRFELTQSSDVSVIRPEGVDYDEEYVVSDYVCRARVLLAPAQAGYFSTEQLDAIYDYYQDELIPCLGLRGYTINGPHPRADFTDGPEYALWSPYNDLDHDTMTPTAIDQLSVSCPPYPPYISDVIG